MRIRTDFGEKKIKPNKTFFYKEIRFAICEVPSKLDGLESPTVIRRLVHFKSGKIIPITFLAEKTALDCVNTANKRLDKIRDRVGNDFFFGELEKQDKLN